MTTRELKLTEKQIKEWAKHPDSWIDSRGRFHVIKTKTTPYDHRVNQELHDLRELVNRLNGIVEQQRRDIDILRNKTRNMDYMPGWNWLNSIVH